MLNRVVITALCLAANAAVARDAGVGVDGNFVYALEQSAIVPSGRLTLLIGHPTNICFPAESADAVRVGSTIQLRLRIADYSPCDPSWTTPRKLVWNVRWPEGKYRVNVHWCVNAPPPIHPCVPVADFPFEVREISLDGFEDYPDYVVPPRPW